MSKPVSVKFNSKATAALRKAQTELGFASEEETVRYACSLLSVAQEIKKAEERGETLCTVRDIDPATRTARIVRRVNLFPPG